VIALIMADSRNNLPHVMVVLGTRPEAIKLAPVIRCLHDHAGLVRTTVCSTGQHRDLLLPILQQLNLQPDLSLDVFSPGQSLDATFARVLTGLSDVFRVHKPTVVIVQGDVTTTAAAAVAAMQQRIGIAHVEAGLRTGNKLQPWPEETHRRMIGQLADWHFAPTAAARDHLLRENVTPASIDVVGNTGIDMLRLMLPGRFAQSQTDRTREVLLTFHRREIDASQRAAIIASIARVAAAHESFDFLWPVHPSTRHEPAVRLASDSRIRLVDPMPYPQFVLALARCALVLTDSGGVQEEAAALGTPTLVVREESCRPEGIAAGVAQLAGVDPARVASALHDLLTHPDTRHRMSTSTACYGDGFASQRIVDRLLHDLGASS
jgi:UDP-N-acetylglucosamine 2-epimerase (non-hydrolysing)